MADLTLILGGARSGKSARALAIAPPPHVFIATGEALDGEMAERIRLHQAERDPSWTLVEAPLDLAAAIQDAAAPDCALVIDCLTLWLSNLMHHQRDPDAETRTFLVAAQKAPGQIICVSNEIGLGLAPMESLSRRFRDAQGRLNQRVAAQATRVEFVAAGLPLTLKDMP
ncbi:MAG: bifunctional adenosylcobinamide kinase/adenosylcobinamide-phosphate guanylyltransferase [Pseudomonadota bacterium]